MGIWSSIRSLFVVDVPAPALNTEPQRATLPKHITDEWFSGLSSSKSGVAVTPNSSLAITAFWRAINILSGVIASLPFDVYEVTDDSAIKRRTHPLSRVLRRSPSPLYTKFDFFQTLILHLFTYGNFYAQIRRDGRGEVKMLEIIDPNRVKVTSNARGEVIYEVEKPEGKQRMIWYNVVHVSGLSWSGLQGMNIVEEFKDVLGTAIANQDYLANFYGNGATLSGVVSVPQKLDSESYTRLRNSWNNSYSGTHNAGATAILEQGASYQKVGLSPQEAGSDTAKKMSISDVARITGVPQFLLEDLDRATFNNIEHLGQLFVTYTILPLCENIQAELSRKLLTEAEMDTHEIRADLHMLLRADTENRAKLIESMMKWGIINRDEARSIEGLNPIADGSGQAYYIPMNMIDPTKEEPGEEAANNVSDEERQAQR